MANTTDDLGVQRTTDATTLSDISLLQSLVGRPSDQKQPIAEQQGQAPSLSELLVHGVPQGQQYPDRLGLSQSSYQLPSAGAGREDQVTGVAPAVDSAGASNLADAVQPQYPGQSEPQEANNEQQLLQSGGLQREPFDESGFQDLGSLEAAQAGTDQMAPLNELSSSRYAYPGQEPAMAGDRSGQYPERPRPSSNVLLSPQSVSQAAEGYQPQLVVDASHSLDGVQSASPVSALTDSRIQATQSPGAGAGATGEDRDLKETTEQPDRATTEADEPRIDDDDNGVNQWMHGE